MQLLVTSKMAEEEVQYHIEIQDGHNFDESGEVMVVLDLNGQDLPESVAQTILELAQNSRQNQRRGGEHLAQMIVEERQKQGQGGEFIEYITEDGGITYADPSAVESEATYVTDVKFEDIDSIFNAQEADGTVITEQSEVPSTIILKTVPKHEVIKPLPPPTITSIETESGPRILVKNLAELEQLKASNIQTISRVPLETKSRSLLKDIHEIKREMQSNGEKPGEVVDDASERVEMGVQCEIMNDPEDGSSAEKSDATQEQTAQQSSSSSQEANSDQDPNFVESSGESPNPQGIALAEKIDEGETGDMEEQCTQSIKNEPMCADENVAAAAAKPAEPEETAAVPPVPAADQVEKSCSQCDFTCRDDLELGRHMKQIHKEQKAFNCSICHASFELELSFQIHQLLHVEKPVSKTRKKNFVCPLCELAHSSRKSLRLHAKHEHGYNKIFICEKCKFTSLSKDEMVEHKSSHTNVVRRRKGSVCPVCKITCMKLPAHLNAVHRNARPYPCTECDYRGKNKYALENHMFSHRESKDFVCPQCAKACKSKISLKRHIKNHDPVKKHHCPKCDFTTNDSYEQKRHMTRVHTRKNYYGCKFCNLSFVNHCDLKLHAMSEHNSKDNFYCKQYGCEFSCELKVEFKRHVQTHTGKHRYLCEICDFTTAWKAHLDRHLATHSDSRPLTCPTCGFRCREQINLKKHMVIHSDAKPFKCPHCPYRCKLKNLLDSHTRIMHSSLKPFSCSKCAYSTKTASNLKKHMWIHDQYRPFKCRHCDYTARERNKLRRHEKTKHKDAVQEEHMETEEEEKEIPITLKAEPVEEGFNMVFTSSTIQQAV